MKKITDKEELIKTYVKTPTPQIVREVQKTLFKVGFRWSAGMHEILYEDNCYGLHLHPDLTITYNTYDDMEAFGYDDEYGHYKEISYKSILDKKFLIKCKEEEERRIKKKELIINIKDKDLKIIKAKEL